MAKGSYEGEGRTFNRAVHDVVDSQPKTEKTQQMEDMVTVHTPLGLVEVPKSIHEARLFSTDERITGGYR